MTYSIFWPGTNIPKSQGNGFDLSMPSPNGAAAKIVAAQTYFTRTKAPEGAERKRNELTGISKKADEANARRKAQQAILKARHGGAYTKAVAQ